MTLWKRAMDYLGLGPEDPYDDYDMPQDMDPRGGRPGRPGPQQWEPEPSRGRPRGGGWDEDANVRPTSTRVGPRDLEPVPPRRPAPMDAGDPSGLTVRLPNRGPVHQPVARGQQAAPGEPYTVKPRRFDQAQELADKFKEGQPVIMNLEAADREVSRRLIDFASGLCYGLSGTMEKVATGVYLLKPFSGHGPRDGYSD